MGRALTTFEAGFAANVIGSFVNGLTPSRASVAGFCRVIVWPYAFQLMWIIRRTNDQALAAPLRTSFGDPVGDSWRRTHSGRFTPRIRRLACNPRSRTCRV